MSERILSSEKLRDLLNERYTRINLKTMCAQTTPSVSHPKLAVWVHESPVWVRLSAKSVRDLWQANAKTRSRSFCHFISRDLLQLTSRQYANIKRSMESVESEELMGLYQAKKGVDDAPYAIVLDFPPSSAVYRNLLLGGAALAGALTVGGAVAKVVTDRRKSKTIEEPNTVESTPQWTPKIKSKEDEFNRWAKKVIEEEKKVEELKAEVAASKDALTRVRQEEREIQARIDKSNLAGQDFGKLVDEYEIPASPIKTDRPRHDRLVVDLISTLNEKRGLAKTLEGEYKDLESRSNDVSQDTELIKRSVELAVLKEEIRADTEKLNAIKKVLQTTQDKLRADEVSGEEAEAYLAEINTKLDNTKDAIEKLVQQAEDEYSQDVANKQSQLNRLDEEIRRHQEHDDTLSQKIRADEARLAGIQNARSTALQATQELEARLGVLTQHVESLQAIPKDSQQSSQSNEEELNKRIGDLELQIAKEKQFGVDVRNGLRLSNIQNRKQYEEELDQLKQQKVAFESKIVQLLKNVDANVNDIEDVENAIPHLIKEKNKLAEYKTSVTKILTNLGLSNDLEDLDTELYQLVEQAQQSTTP